MKPKKIKARKMWGDTREIYSTKTKACFVSDCIFDVSKHYALPADTASVEATVEQMARSVCENSVPWDHIGYGAQQIRLKMFRAALAAIGIK